MSLKLKTCKNKKQNKITNPQHKQQRKTITTLCKPRSLRKSKIYHKQQTQQQLLDALEATLNDSIVQSIWINNNENQNGNNNNTNNIINDNIHTLSRSHIHTTTSLRRRIKHPLHFNKRYFNMEQDPRMAQFLKQLEGNPNKDAILQQLQQQMMQQQQEQAAGGGGGGRASDYSQFSSDASGRSDRSQSVATGEEPPPKHSHEVNWSKFSPEVAQWVDKENYFDPQTFLPHRRVPGDDEIYRSLMRKKKMQTENWKPGPYGRLHRDADRGLMGNDPSFIHDEPKMIPYELTPNSFDPNVEPPPGFRKYEASDGTWIRHVDEKSDHEPYFVNKHRNGQYLTSAHLTRPDRRRRVYTYMQYDPIDYIHYKNQRTSYWSQSIWFTINSIMDFWDSVVRFLLHFLRPIWIGTKVMFRIPEFTIKFLLQVKIEIVRYIERRWGPPDKRDPDVYKLIPGVLQAVFRATGWLSDYIERWGTRDPDVGDFLKKHRLLELNVALQQKANFALDKLQERQYKLYLEHKHKKIEKQRKKVENEREARLAAERLNRQLYEKYGRKVDNFINKKMDRALNESRIGSILDSLEKAKTEETRNNYVEPFEAWRPLRSFATTQSNIHTNNNHNIDADLNDIAAVGHLGNIYSTTSNKNEQLFKPKLQSLHELALRNRQNGLYASPVDQVTGSPSPALTSASTTLSTFHSTKNNLTQVYAAYLKNNPQFTTFYYKCLLAAHDLTQAGIPLPPADLIKISRMYDPMNWDIALENHISSLLIAHPEQTAEIYDVLHIVKAASNTPTKPQLQQQQQNTQKEVKLQRVLPYMYNTNNTNPFYKKYYQQTRHLYLKLQELGYNNVLFETMVGLLDQSNPQDAIQQYLTQNVIFKDKKAEDAFYAMIDKFPETFDRPITIPIPAAINNNTTSHVIAQRVPLIINALLSTEELIQRYDENAIVEQSIERAKQQKQIISKDDPETLPPQYVQELNRIVNIKQTIVNLVNDCKILDVHINPTKALLGKTFYTANDAIDALTRDLKQSDPHKYQMVLQRLMLREMLRKEI